jgi:hypothetical protein
MADVPDKMPAGELAGQLGGTALPKGQLRDAIFQGVQDLNAALLSCAASGFAVELTVDRLEGSDGLTLCALHVFLDGEQVV